MESLCVTLAWTDEVRSHQHLPVAPEFDVVSKFTNAHDVTVRNLRPGALHTHMENLITNHDTSIVSH